MVVSEKDAIWRAENNIIWLKLNQGLLYDHIDVNRIFQTFSKFEVGVNNKALLMIDASTGCTMTKEARDLSEELAKDFFYAIAAIGDTPAAHWLVNFLNAFHYFGIPLKLFPTEETAFRWINKQPIR